MVEKVKLKSLDMQLRRKILSEKTSEDLAAVIFSDNTSSILEELFKILTDYKSKKKAAKFLNYLLKILIKVAVFQQENEFNR